VKVTREIAAEAAVWIARLHGPDRSPDMERECLAWQARSAAHRLAFERCTDVWEAIPGVRLADAYASAAAMGSVPGAAAAARSGRWHALAVACAVCVSAAGGWGWHQWREAGVYATAVGEQRVVVLDDGTRMSLNTDTRARTRLDPALRFVEVQHGEALFEVAKDARRPFVVRVADSEVVAVGTVFTVRVGAEGRQADRGLAVTLIEGRVTVQPATESARDGIAPSKPLPMRAGDRVRLVKRAGNPAEPATEQVDRPSIDQVTAWRRSEAVFDDEALADAVADMNRYSRTPIVLVDASLATLRVSGMYRTGDSAGFVRAVAALHGLEARETNGRLELTRPQ
jgi:transmembrane sensor